MTTNLIFGQTTDYAPGDTITFQVATTEPMSAPATFIGTVEFASGVILPLTGTATVAGSYGPFSGTGYTVTQDATDPSRFTAIPTGS